MTSLPSGSKEGPQTVICACLRIQRLPCRCPCPGPCPLPLACPGPLAPWPPAPALTLPCPALPCPALPCPALPCLPCLQWSATSCDPARVRGAGCLMETHAFHRAAGTGREDPQPDTNPSQQCLVVQLSVEVSNSERKQRARKPPLRGVWGVNPKP